MYTILNLSRFMLMVSVLGLEYKGFVQDSRISEEIRQTFEQLLGFFKSWLSAYKNRTADERQSGKLNLFSVRVKQSSIHRRGNTCDGAARVNNLVQTIWHNRLETSSSTV